MDLWETLGVTREQALLGAVGGLVLAGLFAVWGFARQRRAEATRGLGLDDR
jgi:hypothetical protein